MDKKVIRCSLCDYCKGYMRRKNTRMEFLCEHPDKEYISNYYKEHRIKKFEGFIGFEKSYNGEVPIKSSPAWCPRKKE